MPNTSPNDPVDVDGLLHDFFQAALPRQWPAPPVPQRQVIRGFWQARSRLTLAASIAILLGGSLWLCGLFPERVDSLYRPALSVPTEARRPGPNRLPTPALDASRRQRSRAADTRHH